MSTTYTGRQKIYTDEPVITTENVVEILTEALLIHNYNSGEIAYLYDVYRGEQDILKREKVVRPEICNMIVENRANEIVSFKTGYLCGEPLQYIGRTSEEEISNEISKLNDLMLLCDKPTLDKDLAEWMYIAGTGYRMVLPNSSYINDSVTPQLLAGKSDFSGDEAPFEIYTLDPRYCFVVYHSDVSEKPAMGVKYVVRQDDTTVYSVYTPDKYFEITSSEQFEIANIQDRTVNAIPIIEYPLNNARLGVFEIVLPILNAINTVQSNRIDGVEQFVQSLILLYNCDIDNDAAQSLREAGLVKLKSSGDIQADLKILAEQLDQTQTQTLIDYMYQTVLNIVGMPNRNGGTSTSDTGSAVIMRDGWESAEARAKCDELMFKRSERSLLRIILNIVRATLGTTLSLSNIETKFTRRNYEAILSKSQVLTTMLSNPGIHPQLAFEHCGMFSDPQAAYTMSAGYKPPQAEKPETTESRENA